MKQTVSFKVNGKNTTYELNAKSTAAAMKWVKELFPTATNIIMFVGRK